MSLSILKFPENFMFGTATSSFQVEGNIDKTRSTDWDVFLAEKPNIVLKDEIGPDWWNINKAKEDIKTISSLGTRTIRISIEWARIEPEKGRVNKSAIDKYHEIFDHVRKNGMDPMLTINHFTLPTWVSKRGGWECRKMPGMFEYFTMLLVSHFTDIKNWITINEPNILLQTGYLTDFFPPHKESISSLLVARYNMIKANKKAYQAIKYTIPDANAGAAFALRWYKPENPKHFFERNYAKIVNFADTLNLIDAMHKNTDFIGLNYYTGYYLDMNLKKIKLSMRKDAAGIPESILFGETKKPGAFSSDMGWPIVPDFLLDALKYVYKKYRKQIIITENGIADHLDKYRSLYILTHLVSIWKAINSGVKINSYYHWSTIDNIEWLYGYRKKFGLIMQNPITLEKTLRRSAYLYKDIILSNQLDIERLISTYIPDSQKEITRKIITLLLDDDAKNMHINNYL